MNINKYTELIDFATCVSKNADAFFETMPILSKTLDSDICVYEYDINGIIWKVFDSHSFKLTVNSSNSYKCFFNKKTGYNLRFGTTLDDDPKYCELGPEILDLEIITGSCVPIGGCNCKFCYKGNTNKRGKEMSIETFNEIISRFPKNLSQIAFGITSLHGNKDFKKIVERTRELGIIPNVTTSGADLDDEMCDVITKNMGACAVSCYEADPNLCYKSIKKIFDYGKEHYNKDMHVNMHILFSKQTFDFVMKTLEDVKNGKVQGLKSVVLLRLKNVGNAKDMDPSIPIEMYETVVKYCLENNISFGFDSCGAKDVIKALENLNRPELVVSCEPCESSLFSSYINVDGEYTSCSFVERRPDVIKPINVLNYKSFVDVWHLEPVEVVRNATLNCKTSCPWYNLN